MKKTAKQIAALLGAGLLLLLYILLLIFAIFDFEGSDVLFRACLIGTIFIPIMLWVYMYLYDRLVKRKDDQSSQ